MSKHRMNIWAFLAALAVMWAFTTYYNWSVEHTRKVDAALRAEAPATRWFDVKNLFVPDFEEGQAVVPIIYDRVINREFTGEWSVEVHAINSTFANCSNGGGARYKPGDDLPPAKTTLEWFIGKPCVLPVGQYIVEATWDMKIPDYPDKHQQITSNIFTVFPAGAQKYVLPEQLVAPSQQNEQ